MARVSEQEANLGNSDYARRTKRLIKIIGDIRALGGQGLVDLPRIAVIGNQSAGKSSLIEAISGITVPRAIGTCTRCPMECRLQQQNGTKWHSQVYIRLETDKHGNPLKEIEEKPFGGFIHEKDELETMLRRAQLAILNPSVPIEQFVDFDVNSFDPNTAPLGSKDRLAFSSNVVCVTVWGPDVPDLSFIDLPGIIQNEVEPGSMEAVKNMVVKHIQGNCLILLTITMRDDIENQNAAFLAKQLDKEGHRTVGVLTKPDTLQEGEEKGWLDIIEGREHPLTLGYFVTKQPAPKDVEDKISHQDARKAELNFFDNHPVWSKCTKGVRSRMGTACLGMTLSRLLSQLIGRTLPKLREEVRTHKASTDKQLSVLPPRLAQAPSLELLKLVAAYTDKLNSLVQGEKGYRELLRLCKPTFSNFRAAIRHTAPRFIPRLAEQSHADTPPHALDSPPSGVFVFGAPRRKANLPRGLAVSPSSTASNETKTEPLFQPSFTAMSVEPAIQRSATGPGDNVSEYSEDSDNDGDPELRAKYGRRSQKPLYLDDIRKMIQVHHTRELPYSVPFRAKVELISNCFEGWEAMANKCADVIIEASLKMTLEHVQQVFGSFNFAQLDSAVEAIVESQIRLLSQQVKERLKWLIDLEASPYTQNYHYFSSYRDKYLSRYKSERSHNQGPRAKSSDDNTARVKEAIRMLRALEYDVKNEADLDRLRPPDEYEQELIVAAEVRAYFQVAYKRIIDNVPRVIDSDFLKRLRPTIKDALEAKFFSDDKAAIRYMAEDPDIGARREDLEAKSARLLEIGNKLDFSLDSE